MKVVILAGGKGTRLREETDHRPKPMIEIGGRPILWHIMKLYAHHGFSDFVLCLGYGAAAVKDYFHNNGLHRATSYCLAEALSALKSKWLRKRIDHAEYLHDVREFFRLVVPHLTQVDVPLAGIIRTNAERMMDAHRLDCRRTPKPGH